MSLLAFHRLHIPVLLTVSSYRLEQSRDWRTAAGKKPTNLDLFMRLRGLLEIAENQWDMDIKLVWIPREHNSLADAAAKAAAVRAVTVEQERQAMIASLDDSPSSLGRWLDSLRLSDHYDGVSCWLAHMLSEQG